MRPAVQPTIPPRSLETSVKFLSLAMIFTALVFAFTDSVGWYISLSVISILIWSGWHREQWQVFGIFGGVANVLTGLRWLGIAALGIFCEQLHPYIILVLGILVLVLDGLDGYYARKYQTTSILGDVLEK